MDRLLQTYTAAASGWSLAHTCFYVTSIYAGWRHLSRSDVCLLCLQNVSRHPAFLWHIIPIFVLQRVTSIVQAKDHIHARAQSDLSNIECWSIIVDTESLCHAVGDCSCVTTIDICVHRCTAWVIHACCAPRGVSWPVVAPSPYVRASCAQTLLEKLTARYQCMQAMIWSELRLYDHSLQLANSMWSKTNLPVCKHRLEATSGELYCKPIHEQCLRNETSKFTRIRVHRPMHMPCQAAAGWTRFLWFTRFQIITWLYSVSDFADSDSKNQVHKASDSSQTPLTAAMHACNHMIPSLPDAGLQLGGCWYLRFDMSTILETSRHDPSDNSQHLLSWHKP